MRQAFSFYKSFDDTFEALNDQQALILFKTLRDVQFLRINILDVKFNDPILTIIWQSIKFSLEKSIKGYLDSQLNSRVKNPYFGCYHPYEGAINKKTNPSQTPFEGVSQQCKEECKEKEELKYNTYIEKYKIYVSQLLKDAGYVESVYRNHFKHSNFEIMNLTLIKYFDKFLSHLQEIQEKHNTKKDFQYHFSNWLRKQQIEYVIPKQKIQRMI